MQLKHTKKVCAVYGEGAVTDQTCQKWFAKFCPADFLQDDAPTTVGRLVEVESDQIETLIKNNQRYTAREVADILRCPNQVLKVIYTSLMFGFHIK